MFNDVERLVGGAGTSALTFLYTAMLGANFKKFTGGKTVVIGEEDLWNATKAGGQADHAMGQPREFLYPIHQTGKVSIIARRRAAKQGWNYLEFANVLSEAAQEHEVVEYRQI